MNDFSAISNDFCLPEVGLAFRHGWIQNFTKSFAHFPIEGKYVVSIQYLSTELIDIEVSASIGIGSTSADSDCPSALMQTADQALYREKGRRRDGGGRRAAA